MASYVCSELVPGVLSQEPNVTLIQGDFDPHPASIGHLKLNLTHDQKTIGRYDGGKFDVDVDGKTASASTTN